MSDQDDVHVQPIKPAEHPTHQRNRRFLFGAELWDSARLDDAVVLDLNCRIEHLGDTVDHQCLTIMLDSRQRHNLRKQDRQITCPVLWP